MGPGHFKPKRKPPRTSLFTGKERKYLDHTKDLDRSLDRAFGVSKKVRKNPYHDFYFGGRKQA